MFPQPPMFFTRHVFGSGSSSIFFFFCTVETLELQDNLAGIRAKRLKPSNKLLTAVPLYTLDGTRYVAYLGTDRSSTPTVHDLDRSGQIGRSILDMYGLYGLYDLAHVA